MLNPCTGNGGADVIGTVDSAAIESGMVENMGEIARLAIFATLNHVSAAMFATILNSDQCTPSAPLLAMAFYSKRCISETAASICVCDTPFSWKAY